MSKVNVIFVTEVIAIPANRVISLTPRISIYLPNDKLRLFGSMVNYRIIIVDQIFFIINVMIDLYL